MCDRRLVDDEILQAKIFIQAAYQRHELNINPNRCPELQTRTDGLLLPLLKISLTFVEIISLS